MMSNATLQARIVARLEKTPDQRAIGFYGFKGEQSWITCGELYDRGRTYSARLASQGIRKGDICIIVLPSGELCTTVLLGTLFMGAIPLLVAPPSMQGEPSSRTRVLNRIISKTKAKMVICHKSMEVIASDIRGNRKNTKYLYEDDEISTATGEEGPIHLPTDSDLAALQLTSGTTGYPRVCVWKQKGVVASLDGMIQAMQIHQDDSCLNWTPLYHDMGLVNNFFFCLTNGIPLTLMSPLDFVKKPALWLRGLCDVGATFTWSPNFGFAITAQRVRDQEIEGVRLDHVQAFWNAAERIHLETIQAFSERFAPYGVGRNALKTNFGCAENVGGATFSDPQGPFLVEHVNTDSLHKKGIAATISSSDDGARITSIIGVGRPCPGMGIKILSRTGQPLPDGHVGKVALETPSRMVGYLADAGQTKKSIDGPYLLTGDIGYVRGEELFWVGRVKERLTIRGRKLDPSDFEPILLGVSGLRLGCFVAFGVDDEKRGTQRVVIATEVRDPSTVDGKGIIGTIRERVLLQLGIAVDEVILVQPGTLSKTTSGKRRHRSFRQQYLDGKLEPFQISN